MLCLSCFSCRRAAHMLEGGGSPTAQRILFKPFLHGLLVPINGVALSWWIEEVNVA